MAFAPLAGMIAGPLLEGALAGGALGGLATTLGAGGLGALTSGTIGLLQGHGILGAGLDALGGYGGAGGISDLAKFGASGAAGAAPAAASEALEGGVAQGTLTSAGTGYTPTAVQSASFQMDPAYSQFTTPAPTPPFSLANAQAGVGKLFESGGMDAFKAATNKSALSSLGMPAAGLAIGAMTPPANYGIAPDPYAGSLGSFTPMSELRRRAQSNFAEGGIASLNPMDGMFDARRTLPAYNEPQHETYKKGGFLNGPGDGMSDSIPATIGNKQPARLADGEFVVPADVVSHLGNGSTKAGAQRLYAMMDKVRKARTGTTKQGKQIQPERYMPA